MQRFEKLCIQSMPIWKQPIRRKRPYDQRAYWIDTLILSTSLLLWLYYDHANLSNKPTRLSIVSGPLHEYNDFFDLWVFLYVRKPTLTHKKWCYQTDHSHIQIISIFGIMAFQLADFIKMSNRINGSFNQRPIQTNKI